MTTAITKPEDSDDLKTYLMKGIDALKGVAARYMDPQRLVRIALVARAKTPMLAKCSKESILLSLMQAAEMGLEPNTPLQHAALVPRKNKQTGMNEAHFLPMYRGLIELGRRSGVLRTARAVPIYNCDKFKITEGLTHTIDHEPNFEHEKFGDPNEVKLVYAVAELTGGGAEWTYMTEKQIMRIQDRSPAGKDGPWQTDWEEMAKKTVLRRLMKLLPMTIEVAKALDMDNEDDRFDMSQVAAAAAASADAQEAAKVVELKPGAAGELPPGDDSGAKLAEELKKAGRGKEKDKVPVAAPPTAEAPQGKLV